MAMMHFREPNQVKWVGVRPGHNGEQIIKQTNVANGTVVVYTVTVGKTLYLCTAELAYVAVGAARAELWVESGGGVYLAGLLMLVGQAAVVGDPHIITFWPPLEVPSQYVIKLRSWAAAPQVYGMIYGWEE